ncbi:MAG: hypothetical protein Q7V13_12390 [Phenylobacterium sp.]|uniref:terminase small subunit-like protein n=1 Tax=Phenylobacterium sp. TaxID=1871053 RepID=UPI002720E66D|nr:hypothetical protein [Phenylobacterium sp.]MDO8912643.1 hypothetical protein [Phenylobacterium sp.]
MSSRPPPFGRPDRRPQVRYSPELGKLICDKIAAGQSEASLGREPGMPSVQAIYKWRAREPGFAAAYEAAQDQARRDRRARDRAEDEDRRWRQALRPRQDGRRGRVSTYTDELGGVILRRIAAGETVLSIGADADMPCASTIYHWIRADDGFHDAYLKAKAVAADIFADAMLEIALESTESTARGDALRIKTLRWTAAMLAPKKYGARRALAPEPEEEAQQPIVVVIRKFGMSHDEALATVGRGPLAETPEPERDWWSTPS